MREKRGCCRFIFLVENTRELLIGTARYASRKTFRNSRQIHHCLVCGHLLGMTSLRSRVRTRPYVFRNTRGQRLLAIQRAKIYEYAVNTPVRYQCVCIPVRVDLSCVLLYVNTISMEIIYY